MMAGNRTMRKEKSLKRLIRVFSKKHLLFVGVFISVLHSIVTITFGYLLKILIDAATTGEREPFFFVLYLSIGLLSMNAIFSYLRTRTIGAYAEFGIAALRRLYTQKVSHLTYEQLQSTHSGELLSLGTNDMNRVKDFTFSIVPRLIEVPLTALLALIVLIYLSWQLTLFSLLMIPVLIIGSSLLIKPIGPVSKRVQAKLGNINMVSTDYIKGVEVAKAYHLEQPMIEKSYQLIDESISIGKQLARKRGFLSAFSQSFSILPFISTFIFGGYLVIQGHITVGSLLAFVNLLNFLTWPLTQMSVLIGDAKRDLASANRLFDTIDQPLEREDGEDFDCHDGGPVIQFKDVTFTYPGDQKPVIQSFNLEIQAHQSVAIVGPSGSGKSTLIKLLMGYYDRYEGSIEVFGHDVNTWSLDALRRNLSLVSQDTFLFPESVFENIENGCVGIEESEVYEAAKKAEAHAFIMAFEKGYQTLIGEMGNTLSGGQKQRISIARAILKNAPILLLDEATSALDAESEAMIQETLNEVLKGKTSVIIAHRLSTIKQVDIIHVMDEGIIKESGTHHELMQLNGIYSRLYNKQIDLDEGGGN